MNVNSRKESDGEIMRRLLNMYLPHERSITSNKKELLKEHNLLINNFIESLIDNPSLERREVRIVKEGLITSYPIEKTAKFIKRVFSNYKNTDLNTQIVQQPNNDISGIEITFPDYPENRDIVENEFKKCGFYYTKDIEKSAILTNDGVLSLVRTLFLPKFTPSIENIREKERFLYHATPTYNEEKILKIGFVPRDKNNITNYPSRIFFSRGSGGFENTKKIATQLCIYNKKLKRIAYDKREFEKYTIFKIDLFKIPENIKIYSDSESKNSVFITENLLPTCIVEMRHYMFDIFYNDEGDISIKSTELK